MAQRPILPLTSGIGQVTPVPINVGGAGTAEAEFRRGLKSPYASGINSAFESIFSNELLLSAKVLAAELSRQ